MAQTISSTTRHLRSSSHSLGVRRSAHFLNQAHVLLATAIEARSQGESGDAAIAAYRAGLRTAGAIIATSPISGRRRLPSSAWHKLELVGGQWAAWAARLSRYSPLSSRLSSGLMREVEPMVLDRFIEEVGSFLAAAEFGGDTTDGLSAAA